jgi:hypothetical protein
MVLFIEIWFQSEFYSAYHEGSFSMKFAGTTLLISHYLYFISATLSLRHGILPFFRLDQDIDTETKTNEGAFEQTNSLLEEGKANSERASISSTVSNSALRKSNMSMSFVVMEEVGAAKNWQGKTS